jgi:capsular exopolysaccharide synthesis family protein
MLSSRLQELPVERAVLESNNRTALLMNPQSIGADRFRYMRMRFRELRQLAKLQSVLITSPIPGDGKSTTAMCLATALAEGGKHSVLLIEADLYHPGITEYLGLPAHAGLAECLENGSDPISEIRKVEPFNWHLLQAGKAKANPTELLHGEALSVLMQKITSFFDWIVVDSPPTLAVTDALSLSRQVDATLLVARANQTPREAIERSVKLIGPQHIVGIVLNGAEGLSRRYSKYDSYYGSKG